MLETNLLRIKSNEITTNRVIICHEESILVPGLVLGRVKPLVVGL